MVVDHRLTLGEFSSAHFKVPCCELFTGILFSIIFSSYCYGFSFNSLNVISLNVRGIRDITKRKAIFLFCRRTEADLILLQETHSCESDTKFWRTQWGNTAYFSHGSNHSAGVLIFLHKLKGDILETVLSDDGRWIILVIKQDNAIFIVCNLYGYNSHASNKIFFNEIIVKLKELHKKYHGSHIILGGDFNECPDDTIDR